MKKKRYSTKKILLVYSAMIFIVVLISFAVSMYFSRSIKAAGKSGESHKSITGLDVDASDADFNKYHLDKESWT